MGDVYDTEEQMGAAALELAALIASKSPLAVSGTKKMLNYSRDHTVREGLEYVATWNAAMLQAGDMMEAFTASMSKGAQPQYEKLAGSTKSKL